MTDQLDLFGNQIEVKTPYEVCIKTLKRAYTDVSESTIKLGIKFAGFPMYEDEKFRDTFFWRVNHYIKNLHDIWGENWENQYAHRKQVFKKQIKLLFKEDVNMTLWI